jgi:hypothetical protein
VHSQRGMGAGQAVDHLPRPPLRKKNASEASDRLTMAGASLKVGFLRYPFALPIGFLDSCRMLRSDDARPREEQPTTTNGNGTHA